MITELRRRRRRTITLLIAAATSWAGLIAFALVMAAGIGLAIRSISS